MWSPSWIWCIRSSAQTGLCRIVCCHSLHASICCCRGKLTLQIQLSFTCHLDWQPQMTLSCRVCLSSDRLTSVINPPVDVIASCVNCLSVLAARMPGKVSILVHKAHEGLESHYSWIMNVFLVLLIHSGVVQSAPHWLPPLCLQPFDQHGSVCKVKQDTQSAQIFNFCLANIKTIPFSCG